MKIGLFDSGIGGITILSEIVRKFKDMEIIYLCDNKYLPYGDKTIQFIKDRLDAIMHYFLSNFIGGFWLATGTICFFLGI